MFKHMLVIAALTSALATMPADGQITPQGPAQFSKQRAMVAKSLDLALGYRVTTDMLPVIELAQEGRMTLSILDGGQQRGIDKSNVTAWIEEYRRRQTIFSEIIESRGYVNVSGNYAMRAGPGCSGAVNEEHKVLIVQTGSSLRIDGDGVEGSIGTVAEKELVINFGGLVGTVDYFVGVISGKNLVITTGSCSFTLVKK